MGPEADAVTTAVGDVSEAVSTGSGVTIYIVTAVITIALLRIAGAVWKRYASRLGDFEKYKAYAVMAAKYAESAIPDDFGTGKEDSRISRGAHKLDMYLKEFANAVRQYEGKDVNEKLKAKAMEWSVELAKDLGTPKGKK